MDTITQQNLIMERDRLEEEITYLVNEIQVANEEDAQIMRDTYEAYRNRVNRINRQLGL